MNIIDIVILAIVAISTIFGLYRGFLNSVLNLGGGIISFFVSFKIGPKLADFLQAKTSLYEMLSGYADLSSISGTVNDTGRSIQEVVRQGTQAITDIVNNVNLPAPLTRLLESNIANQVFGGENDVKYYISQTVAQSIMNILCYVVCFFLVWLVVAILMRLLQAVFRLPALKQLNALAGGALGILRGVLIVFVLLSAVPLLQTVVNMDSVNEIIDQSALASWFTGGNLITAISKGHL